MTESRPHARTRPHELVEHGSPGTVSESVSLRQRLRATDVTGSPAVPVLFLLVAVAYGSGSLLAYEWFNAGPAGATFFPAAGVSLAVLTLVPLSRWPVVWAAVAVAEVTLDTIHGISLAASFGYAAANVVEPTLGATLLRLVVGNVDLARIRDLVGFLACAVVAAPAVGGAIGATVFRLDQGGSWARFAGEWWVGDGLGVLVVGSAIIAWTSRGRLGTLLQPEPLILTGASVVLTVAVFWLEWIALAYVLVGLSVVIAVRLGTLPVAIAGAGVAFVAAQATASGHVFWDDLDIAADTALVHLQLLIALQVSAGLVIAAAVQSRDVAEDEARAAKILAHVDEGVVQVDGRRRIRFWNEAAAAITGVRSADAVGRPIGDVIGGWPALERRLAIAPAPGRTESRAVLPATVSGRELWLSMSGVDYGEGVVYAFRDVTGERRLEELKSDFVATVSHELRTPLTSVYGVLKTLGRPESALTPEQEQALLAIGEREANRLRDLIEQILELPVIEGRAQELESVAVDPCATARAAIESMAAAYPGRPVALEAAAGLPAVAADPARLVQVLTNLLDNALKYSFDGGRVGLAIRQRSRTVVFSVSDEGSGIPPAEQDRIFQKFYRVDPTQTGGVGGTGLGLYISRELVTQMGGAISVESQPGRGATFSVELAVHENAQSHD